LFIGLNKVLTAVKTFSPGSSGGVNGLRPQHLIDMLDVSNPGSLGDALVDFVNVVLAGGVPPQVRPFFLEEGYMPCQNPMVAFAP